MQGSNMFQKVVASKLKMNITKPLAQKTVANIQQDNDIGTKEEHADVSKSKKQVKKLFGQTIDNDIGKKEEHADLSKSKKQVKKLFGQTICVSEFQKQSEMGQKQASGEVSRLKVPTKELLSPTTSVFHLQQHNENENQEAFDSVSQLMAPKNKLPAPATFEPLFQPHNNIGKKEVQGEVSKPKVPKRKLLDETTFLTQFQSHNQTGHREEARGGISKFKVPKKKLLTETSVNPFEEHCGIGQPEQLEAHNGLSTSKMSINKLFAETTSVTQFQPENEIGQEEALKVPEIARKRQKSGSTIKRPCKPSSTSKVLRELEIKYRAMRHKYLILEEENSMVEENLKKTDSEVENLEKEKLALLDKLVVLEGLVDPSMFESRGQNPEGKISDHKQL